MSIIQSIRDRGAVISVIIIALALLGFIAMDALTGRSNIFGGSPSTTVGKVNGEKIGIQEFQTLITQNEQNMQSQGYPSGEATRQQAMESAWAQEVNRILLKQELDKLGIEVGKKEMGDMLYGPNPSPVAKQYLGGQDGQYNVAQVQQTISEIQKGRDAARKEQLNQLLNYMKQVRLEEKYNSLFTNSTNFPKWLLEKQNADNSQLGRISFVRVPYTEIPDSSVKISDKEVADYISKHKEDFKQEESRSIAYLSFSASPNGKDTAETIEKLKAIAPSMAAAKDDEIENFLAAEGAANFYNGYINGKTIQIAQKDSIFRTPVGTIYGPYLDGGSFTIAKMLGVKQMPDSAKVRHILISTMQIDPQTRQSQMVRDDATALKLIDSVKLLINSGQPFDSVCVKLSEDPGSKDKGGVYDIGSGQMVAPFNDFSFTNAPGSKGVVKTEFGYHYIEVISQKGSATGYKIAYLSKPVVASQETINEARNNAGNFAGKARDEKTFNETFDKEWKAKGYNKGIGLDISPTAYQVTGLGFSRDFVRKIYEAKRGEVLQPERVEENYVVAVVTEVQEKGTQPVGKARAKVEPLLRNHKKAEQIKTKIGPVTTLEAAAAKLGKLVEVADSLRFGGGQSTIGFEPKVLGATFNPASRGKVITEPIEGTAGVYIVRVDNVTATAIADANVAEQRKQQYEKSKQSGSSPLMALREAASISDNRTKHF